MRFKKLTGFPEFELNSYVKQYMEDHRDYDVKIYLGCDSQTKGDQTIYATTVVFHVAATGCHVIYKKETMPVIRDMWTRLWKEAEESVDTIDLDYNIDPKYGSNKLVSAAVGYVESLGFKARCKPELLPGCYAADGIVN